LEVYTGFWWGNLRERDCLDDTGIDGRIILKWIFRKWGVRAQDRERWLAGTCECSNEPLGSIKCREFLDQMRND
jgi:hypothetical protein